MGASVILVIGLAAIFAAAALTMVTIVSSTAARRQVNRSLASVQAMHAAPAPRRQELEKPFADRVLDPAMSRLITLGRRFTADDQVSRIRRRLELAGNPPRWDVDRVVGFKMLGLIAGGPLGLLLALAVGRSLLTSVGCAAVLAGVGYVAPNLTLYQLGYNRRELIRRELPDALDLLTISVEAGLTFDAALAQIARNTSGPLAAEIFRVMQEMQIGLGRADALRALGERSDLPDLRSFVTAMVQADAFGIPIAHVLRGQAKEMRVKRSQRAEELAQKVPVKILFPLIFCILPSLFVVILGPAVIQIIASFGGRF